MEVVLHVYDLSMGMAKQVSQSMLGFQIDGVWHTGVYVFGKEYFYGGVIQMMEPSQVQNQFGLRPVEEIRLGVTTKTKEEFHQFLTSVSSQYQPETYNVFRHNCNNFSDNAAKFLLGGQGIPEHIIELPNRVLNTPFGQMLQPMYTNIENRMSEHMIPFNRESGASTFDAPAAAPAGNATQSVPAPSQGDSVSNMEILVKVASDETPLKIPIRSLDITVDELTNVLVSKSGYAKSDQRLIFRGKFLRDTNSKLSEFGITEETVVHLVPKPDSVRNTSAAQTSSSASFSGEQSLDRALKTVNENGSAPDREVALKTILKIVENVVNYPLEPKYRKIKKENPALTKRLGSVKGSFDVLIALGFQESVVDGEQMLVLNASEEAWQHLLRGKEKIDRALSAIVASASSASMPSSTPMQSPFGGMMPNYGAGSLGQQIPNIPPEMMQNMMSNPMVMNQMSQMLRDPQYVQQMLNNPMTQQMMQNNPMMRQHMEMLSRNPEMLSEMLNNPMVQNMLQNPQLMQSMMGGSGMPGIGGAQSQQSDAEMSEEEMIQEAIRRSLQEQ